MRHSSNRRAFAAAAVTASVSLLGIEVAANSSTPVARASFKSTGQRALPTPTAEPGETTVRTVAELEEALEEAGPGSTITVENGVYQRDGGDRWVAAASGTSSAPIVLKGTRAAILESDSPDGDYGLHITGSYWRVKGITIRNATKGIVLDGSVGTVIAAVEVRNIGDEGVHFRACSSNGVLRKSYVHDTGVESPQYGEGVYAGSANSNWGLYGCGDDGEDDTEGTLIKENIFRDIPAEGADLKEGTDSGTVRGNTFDNVGFSGENSADSAVDAKGNNWQVISNTVKNSTGDFADAFQSHTVYDGYGEDNFFDRNNVVGDIPGFGFGFYPEAGNVATCDNTAPGAELGLVGANGDPVPCEQGVGALASTVRPTEASTQSSSRTTSTLRFSRLAYRAVSSV